MQVTGMLQPRPLYFESFQRSTHRRSRRNRNQHRHRPKPEYERNIVSAFFALASAVLLAIAEAEPKWIKIIGGKCNGDYIGLYKVIAYKSSSDLEQFCYSGKMVLILQFVVSICCIGIVASMFACLLDLCGTLNKILRWLKNNSVANILTVTAAGGSSVLAAAFGLLYCKHRQRHARTQSEEDLLSMELMYSMQAADGLSEIPPPAYAP
ncbi:transmembrane protein 127 isoform X2 [Nematostella vectensis]|uniref:transmembrane protein 127 isoform X2 n=1 Tax=Nematostella vectensis TaxID=45351 RepID=UPI002076E283|nr:transmembrane protein 127 isoform X2 [Nematostella vectensis]